MLNELYQVSQAMERVGITPPPRHPRISPMGKNRELLVLRLNDKAEPADVEFVSGEVGAVFFAWSTDRRVVASPDSISQRHFSISLRHIPTK